MATKQGEQRVIHPFFRRGHSPVLIYNSYRRLLCADFEVTPGTPNPLVHAPVNDAIAESKSPHGDQTQNTSNANSLGPGSVTPSETSDSRHTHSLAMLDHDPNSERRKRRKTDNYNPAEVVSGTVNTIPDKSESHEPQPQTPTSSPDEVLPPIEPQSTNTSAGRKSPRQKTIKLNANGKLLSSPVSATNKDNFKQVRKNKRGKAGIQKHQVVGSKIVVIKYNLEAKPATTIGHLIDDILSGRKKHTAAMNTTLRIPAASTTQDQPAKPTHPFFLKKSTRKADDPNAQSDTQDGTPPSSQQKDLKQVSTPRFPLKSGSSWSSTPSTTFVKRPRYPEPAHPIWPPHGLTHIRGTEDDLGPYRHANTGILYLGQKKSKTAPVNIPDTENVLLRRLPRERSAVSGVMRLPGRHVASGKILQCAVTRQLSEQASSARTKKRSLNSNCHAALTKLHSSLTSSMSAFDLGVFDTSSWAHKYAPQSAEQVLQTTKEVLLLRDWLKYLKVTAVDTGKTQKDDEVKKKMDERKRKRRKKDKLDGFIVSSEEEASEMDEISGSDDELAAVMTTKKTVIRSGDMALSSKSGSEKVRMSNVILISGPSGCGKTASIHAVAKELDFEVFEINPGNRRSAKDILDRVGDMTRNHLVHHQHNENITSDGSSAELVDPRQNKLKGFFQSTSTVKAGAKAPIESKCSAPESETKRSRSQKQSLILLEEADILFEEDKGFWSGVMTLISQSKRPIIITCNNERLLPLQDISFHAILRYRTPPKVLAADYLLLLAANEGHMLKRGAVESLYDCTGRDLRRSIMELDFWCQMAIGSEKSGLDWILDRWPRGLDLDSQGDPLRVLSLNAYEPFMGWFGRDILQSNEPDSEIEARLESLGWWRLSMQETQDMKVPKEPDSHLSGMQQVTAAPNLERLEMLRLKSKFADVRSDLDFLCSRCSLDMKLDTIDASIPPLPEKQRTNYTDGYQLLSADIKPDYTGMPATIGCTFEALLEKAFPHEYQGATRSPDMKPLDGKPSDPESEYGAKILKEANRPASAGPGRAEFKAAFEPMTRADYVFPIPTGRLAPSFENGLRPIAEDLGPYIRGIMAYDIRLAQRRLQLGEILSTDGKGAKRTRQTRASRAALEGGDKAYTRKERWFPSDVNPSLVFATGKQEWQEILARKGYFVVAPPGELPVDCNDGLDSTLGNSAQRSKSSLFADEPSLGGNPGNAGASSLFADDDGLNSGSFWGNSVNKRTKQQIVKTLLPQDETPESYIDAYDLVLSVGDRVGSGVGLTSVREILSSSGLSATDQAKILNLVVSGDMDSSTGLGRGEFSVLLALVGLAQEGEDLTFDAVDDRRKKLPQPRCSYLDALRAKHETTTSGPPSQDRPTTPPAPATPPPEPSSTQSRPSARASMGSFEADPWGSPQLHRGHAHAQTESEHPVLNGYGSVRSGTNAWASRASDTSGPQDATEVTHPNGGTSLGPSANPGFGWGESLRNTSDGQGLGGPVRAGLGGFGPGGSDQGDPNARRRSLGIGRVTNTRMEEVITITLLPEKEGMFMFQHRNYEVKSARRGSTVVRRYSDFVWLLDCLHKRYPFRQLPLLPPKRIAVNGTHLSADSNSFLEKRRRGLVRFTNALVRHPILSQEQLVVMFLTVPTELSVWRKQATISVQDEFAGRALPPDLEDSLPSNLTDLFETVRSGVKRSAEVYINLCTLLERLAKRNEGLAADHLRFSLALQSLTEVTRDTYAVDTNDVPLLNEGIKATARHLSASQSLLEDEARAWEDGMLEDLKRQRDCLVSVREMFDRRDRYARNNIPQLERRIENNERKLQELRARPQGTDKESIVQQHARGVFIKECIRDELAFFQQSQYHISRLHQDWSQERVKYSELQADNWRSLSDQVEGMPLGD
ncbi:sorting nexin Mvp1 [Aspergillus saccharolyticus JOP 1030-1]|uniref:Sorting nexin MVP1 n=1 Tax=Aspergillus saccharolyticus JOP 1030-1 TaxID=1450539 RepID=A0A318ZDZ8_9EURO|nr:hypothetical protein BP01DRAFT_373850 [Aspergillus saccharolyticus JOP 1030-1]PYH45599.1 hypothetical protein BP01DRAFT_373850 [Aspergillus saccharolyticus JOP 1030-1]